MSRKGAPFNCTYEDCTASFSRPDRLKIHLRIHTGERPFVCEYEECDKSYISSTALKRHEATHEGTFRCTVEGCFEILKTKETLQKHIDFFHHKKKHKLYKCTECDKEFNKHNWLQRHMYRHTGIFPHKCPYEDCGKGFLLPSKLKVHIKTHKGHLCKTPGCEKVFYKWSLYVTHLKENHPAVHKCEICKKEFSTSTNLKTHLEIHKLPPRKVFACEEPNCPRFYHSEKNLKWHVKSYHKVRTHVCDKEHCHRAFKTKEALEHHMLRHIRRNPRKKKKPRPSFSAILSGCADPRKFTRRMPQKPIASDSSDEFTTDEEISYQDTSSENETPEKALSEMNYADEQVSENIDCPSHSGDSQFRKIPPRKRVEPDSTDMDSSHEEPSSKNTDPSHSGDSQFRKIPPRKRVEPDSTDMDSSCESSKNTGADKAHTTIVTQTKQSNQTSIRKRIRLETCTSLDENDFQDISMSSAIGNDCIESVQSRTDSKSMDKDASSSEYETITVSILGNADGKSRYSGSDDVSSCLSEAEDLLSCDDMCSGRE